MVVDPTEIEPAQKLVEGMDPPQINKKHLLMGVSYSTSLLPVIWARSLYKYINLFYLINQEFLWKIHFPIPLKI